MPLMILMAVFTSGGSVGVVLVSDEQPAASRTSCGTSSEKDVLQSVVAIVERIDSCEYPSRVIKLKMNMKRRFFMAYELAPFKMLVTNKMIASANATMISPITA